MPPFSLELLSPVLSLELLFSVELLLFELSLDELLPLEDSLLELLVELLLEELVLGVLVELLVEESSTELPKSTLLLSLLSNELSMEDVGSLEVSVLLEFFPPIPLQPAAIASVVKSDRHKSASFFVVFMLYSFRFPFNRRVGETFFKNG